MWELDHKESLVPKKWCFWAVVLEKTLESPLDCKEIQAVHPKGNQSWMFTGRTDVEAETPILWPSDEKNWLTGNDSECWEGLKAGGEGKTHDEMAGWHHWPYGHELRASFGSCWWPGKPDVLQSMGSQRVGHNWMTELTDWNLSQSKLLKPINFFYHTKVLLVISILIFLNSSWLFPYLLEQSCARIKTSFFPPTCLVWRATQSSLQQERVKRTQSLVPVRNTRKNLGDTSSILA